MCALALVASDVQTLILREGIRLVAIGVPVGAVLALPAAGSIGSPLFVRQTRDDPYT